MGRKAKATHEEVLRAAREAFAEGGFEGTSLAVISAKLGLSPAALLRHAPTKKALFAAAMDREDAGEDALPMEFLRQVPGDADPRKTLRRLAKAFIPFFERRIGADVVRFIHGRLLESPDSSEAAFRRRGFGVVVDYMRRAARAGRLSIRDPEAAAMAFMGSLVSYVFLHRVARVIEPPLPLDRYLDNLMSIWTRGAIRTPKRKS